VLDGIAIARGRVRWAGGVAESINLTLPRFAVGEPMRAVLATRVALADAAPFDLRLELDATPQSGPLRLESLSAALSGTGPVPTMTTRGELQFAPWRLDAVGQIAQWPEAWPALPPPLSASAAPTVFAIAQSGESALAAAASLTLRRDDARVDAQGLPDDLLTWIDDNDAPALPPLRASATVPRVEFDGVVLEGVSVELGDTEENAQ
jgi:hypothetical protein